MSDTVTLPVWFVVLMAVLAILALLDRLLIPSIRWALRRRANKAIEELNTRLHLHIRPFKLSRRRVLIDRLLYDPDVLEAVESYAKANGLARDVAMEMAKRYAREIVPAFNAYFYFRIGTQMARWLSQLLYRVRVGFTNQDALKAVDPNASVIFVINHRSNMDYVLVTYVAAGSSALSYAVGEWAQVWPLRELIRTMGGYFIRRKSNDALYRKVLASYVRNATQAGVVQAVFPEGGLSVDGALRPPKLGLISYMLTGSDTEQRDIVFIPVGVNYDRVLEDRLLTEAGARAEAGGKPSFRISSRKLIGFILNSVWLRIRGRWYRYGYACVNFGKPVSLRSYLANQNINLHALDSEKREAEIAKLGENLMWQVAKTVPVLPVSLVALAILEAPETGITAFELKGRVHGLMQDLERRDIYIHIPRHDREYAIDVGLRMLTLRHLVIAENGQFRLNPAETKLLAYYANAIAMLTEKGDEHHNRKPALTESSLQANATA